MFLKSVISFVFVCATFGMVMGMESCDPVNIYDGFFKKVESRWLQRCGGTQRETKNYQTNRAESRELRNLYECAKGAFIYSHVWGCIKQKSSEDWNEITRYAMILKSDVCGTLHNAFKYLNDHYKEKKFNDIALDTESLCKLKEGVINKNLLALLVGRLEILHKHDDWAFFNSISGMLAVLEEMLDDLEKRHLSL